MLFFRCRGDGKRGFDRSTDPAVVSFSSDLLARVCISQRRIGWGEREKTALSDPSPLCISRRFSKHKHTSNMAQAMMADTADVAPPPAKNAKTAASELMPLMADKSQVTATSRETG